MQICMDASSDWLKGIATEDPGTNSSSPVSAEVIPSPHQLGGPLPPIDRRLRPQHDQPLKCPRCDSTHTKFCYYNNYSLSQPRYFCKTCRRYWTKGGSLRNVPVGGGCRKNKRTNPKKQSTNMQNIHLPPATALHLSFSGLQFPVQESSANFAEWKYGYGFGLNVENKLMGGAESGELGIGEINGGLDLSGLHALHALRFSIGAGAGVHGQEMEVGHQGLPLPFFGHDEAIEVDVKPVGKALPIEWHEPYCCADSTREANGYPNETGLWGPMIGNHGPSTAI